MTPTRVVHVIRSRGFAGVERYVSEVANSLHGRGWEVAVIGGDPVTMATALNDDIGYYAASSTNQAIAALLRGGRTPLLHAHMTAAEIASIATLPLTRARVVATRHFAAPRGSTRPVRAAMRVLSHGIHREIAISAFVARAVGGDPTVILNGVRPEPQAGDARRVLVMQRLEPEKHTSVALRAFAQSGLHEIGWELLIAGQGREREELVALARSQGIGASTTFPGFVADTAALRADGGIFLAPAPAEPFGLSVVEAMAAGMPVLAADGGAHRETLGGSGVYFPVDDVDACSIALAELAAAPERRSLLALAVRARHAQHLTLDRHVDALEQVYAATLD